MHLNLFSVFALASVFAHISVFGISPYLHVFPSAFYPLLVIVLIIKQNEMKNSYFECIRETAKP